MPARAGGLCAAAAAGEINRSRWSLRKLGARR